MNIRNEWVSFKIGDIYFPDPQQVAFERHKDDLLDGKVADLSDHGLLKEVFAVVEVEGIEQPVIVPVDRLSGPAPEMSAGEE
ncbi:MAG: hypothetical protein HOP19_20200 [Acidobacteria bacterium]|nr:hypothetical protein [Acidobacteriota bacterium]